MPWNVFMMTSSNGNIFRITCHLCGNSPVPGEFPARRPVTRSFDVFVDPRLNKRLSKQSWGWWFETLSSPLCRHCNGILLALDKASVNPGPGFLNNIQNTRYEDHLTWLLIGWRLCCQPIGCQVWKSLLTNMYFNMDISLSPGPQYVEMKLSQCYVKPSVCAQRAWAYVNRVSGSYKRYHVEFRKYEFAHYFQMF